MGFEWTWLGKQNTRWNKYSPLWIHKAPQARSAKRCGRRPKAEGGAEGEAEGVKREALKARSAAGAEGVKREAPKESKASKQLNNRLFSTGWDGGGSLFSWSGTCKQPVDGMDWKHQGSFRHLCRGGGGIKLKRKSTSSIIGRGLENWENMAEKAEHKFGQIYTPEIKTCVEE